MQVKHWNIFCHCTQFQLLSCWPEIWFMLCYSLWFVFSSQGRGPIMEGRISHKIEWWGWHTLHLEQGLQKLIIWVGHYHSEVKVLKVKDTQKIFLSYAVLTHRHVYLSSFHIYTFPQVDVGQKLGFVWMSFFFSWYMPWRKILGIILFSILKGQWEF